MATGPQAKVTITADDSPLRQSLREMVGKMKDFGDEAGRGVERVNSPLAALRSQFLAVTAIIGGGALFGRAVSETAKMTEQSILLGKALGVSANGARTWLAALDDAGASAEELSGASRGLVKNLRTNEDGLKAMGLATRDANGNLRPMTELMVDAIKLTNEYADGTDRQVAVAQIFGKGVAANSALLKINGDSVRDTAQAMRELGMVVGEEDVAAFERYDAAMDRMTLTKQALTTTIGNSLMPVFTKLAEWFNSIGPAAVVVVRGAIGGLVSVFWGLKNAVTIVWEVINAMVVSVAEPLRALASGLYKLATGDFKGAADEMLNWPQRIGAAWSQAWTEIIKSSEESRDRMADLFLDGPEAAPPKTGGRRARPDRKEEKEKAGASSYMQYYEGMLTEEKRVQSMLEAGREFTKEQELSFWRFIIDNLELTAADRLAVLRKMGGLEVEIARQARKEREALDDAELQGAEKLALAKIEVQATAARLAVDAGQLTKSQLASLEIQFEAERYRIQESGLQERLRLLSLDPNSNPAEMARIKNELLLLEQEHQARRNQLLGAAARERSSLDAAIGESFGNEGMWQKQLDGMLLQAETWRQSLANIFTETGRIFVQKLVTEPAAAWLAGMAKMLLVKLGFAAQEQTVDSATSTAKVAMKGVETAAVVGANAAQAGSGAAASQAAIPIVGPGLALAAMAAVFAAVMALGGRKSARGGYDIPSGVNPLVQTHEEEMILPSPLANAVRRMAAQGEQGRGGDGGPAFAPEPLPYHAMGDWVMLMRPHFVKMLKSAKRDFAF